MLVWINSQINKLQPEILRPEDVASLPTDSYIPKFADIALPSVAVAFGLVVLRHIVDKTIVAPFGAYFNIEAKSTKDKANKHLLLESEYNKCKSPRSDTITVLSKKSGLTEKQVTLWFQKRKKREKTSELKRLQDASWHFIFYIVMSWYGIYVLWDKSWFAKAINCWIGWPAQPVSNGIYWYYLIELGFYISAVYMLFTDHKRKGEECYGHPGYGGQMGFSDLKNKVGMAYLTNDLSVYGLGNDPKFIALQTEFYKSLEIYTSRTRR